MPHLKQIESLDDLNYRQLQAQAKLWNLPGNFKHNILIEIIKARWEGDEEKVKKIVNQQKNERAKKRAQKTHLHMQLSQIGQVKKIGRPRKSSYPTSEANGENLSKVSNYETLPYKGNTPDYLKSILSSSTAHSIQELLKKSKVPNAHSKHSLKSRKFHVKQSECEDNHPYKVNENYRSQHLLSGGNLRQSYHHQMKNFHHNGGHIYTEFNQAANCEVQSSFPTPTYSYDPKIYQTRGESQMWLGEEANGENLMTANSAPPRYLLQYPESATWSCTHDYQPIEYTWTRQPQITYPSYNTYSGFCDDFGIPQTPNSDTLSASEEFTSYQDPVNLVPNYSTQVLPTNGTFDSSDNQVYHTTPVPEYIEYAYPLDNISNQGDNPDLSTEERLSTLRVVSVSRYEYSSAFNYSQVCPTTVQPPFHPPHTFTPFTSF